MDQKIGNNSENDVMETPPKDKSIESKIDELIEAGPNAAKGYARGSSAKITLAQFKGHEITKPFHLISFRDVMSCNYYSSNRNMLMTCFESDH